MTKHRITQTTPYDSPGTLVFCCLKCRRNSKGVTPMEAPNRGGVNSNRRFSINISLHLTNGALQDNNYGKRIGTRMRSIEWRYLQ